MSAPIQKSPCPGCGIELPILEGTTDPYGGASAACFATYGEVMALEFSGPRHYAAHRMSADAYMAQHPSRSSRAAVQSVWVHLSGLCLVLERNMPAAHAGRLLGRLTHRDYEWLTPPPNRGAIHVGHIVRATNADEHFQVVESWARAVWQAWEPHHAAVRTLLLQI